MKVHGANMGPIWGRQDSSGLHFGPMNFVIWWFLVPITDTVRFNRKMSCLISTTSSQISCLWYNYFFNEIRCLVTIRIDHYIACAAFYFNEILNALRWNSRRLIISTKAAGRRAISRVTQIYIINLCCSWNLSPKALLSISQHLFR